jgi:threonylcarbamoyladenosine tRNA methylthiotransferase MtaB
MMRIAFKTFGCRANTNDTDALYLEAKRRGFDVVAEDEKADAYVINTCTVTENADRDARHQANRFKRQNAGALVAMVGCYAQVAKDEIVKLPEVDFVVGTANKFKVLDLFTSHGLQKDQVEEAKGFLPEFFPGSRQSRANIKIQDGCNYRCSFCIIPQARGRSRSLPLDTIVKQVDEAYAQGFNEIVLTGIHLAHYGWDQGTDLLTLVRSLLKKPKGPRVRISTLDPFEIPDELIEMLGDEERLCPHFHIAIQSGSDRILERMRRLYKAQEFVDVAAKVQAKHSDTFIGVDVIVGFPGEGEKEFLETVQCLSSSYWSKLHVFSYSSRKGTLAETLDQHVPNKQIAARSEILRALSDKRYKEFMSSQVGKVKSVLLEKPSNKYSGVWMGHTENYLPTYTKLAHGETKTVLPCLIDKAEGERVWTLVKSAQNWHQN